MSYYIYKICCDDLPNYNYIGSTKAFRQRKRLHKSRVNTGRKEKLYNTIKENGGWDNWRMVILEELGEVSFTEARIKEEEHRVKLNANMNSQKCYTTEEEIAKREKEYREKNKEQLSEHKKEYYQKNIEHIKEKTKEYREQNKEQILEKKKEKITCECGCIIRKDILSRHKKTNNHLELMKHLEKI